MREILSMSTHTVLVWRKILFVTLVRDKHAFVLILKSVYLYFVTNPSVLSVKIIHPPN